MQGTMPSFHKHLGCTATFFFLQKFRKAGTSTPLSCCMILRTNPSRYAVYGTTSKVPLSLVNFKRSSTYVCVVSTGHDDMLMSELP